MKATETRTVGGRPRLATDLRALFAARELVGILGRRDITVRYRQTILGASWIVLQPLLSALILTFVFSRVGHVKTPGTPYFLLAFAGMTGFTTFSSTLIRSSQSLVSNAQIVSKVYFPRLALPLATAYSTAIDVMVNVVVLMALLLAAGEGPPVAVLLVPLWLAAMMLLGFGVGLLSAALMVRWRDVAHVLGLLVQVGLYASPAAYPLSAVPSSVREIYQVNPMVGLLEGLRWSVLGTAAPGPLALSSSALAVAASIVIGTSVFRRLDRTFADVI